MGPTVETSGADAAGGGGQSSAVGVEGGHMGATDGGTCRGGNTRSQVGMESRAWSVEGERARGARGLESAVTSGQESPEGRRSPVLRGRADRNEATTRAGRREGQGEGNAGRPEGPPGTPLREVLVATVREVCEGRSAGTVGGGHTLRGAGGGVFPRASHPADWAASPLSPGSATSRGCPASLLSGPRAASRRLRHLRANALPQPGPTTAPTGGEAARCR